MKKALQRAGGFQVSPILKGTHASSLGGPPPSKGLNCPDTGQGPHGSAATPLLRTQDHTTAATVPFLDTKRKAFHIFPVLRQCCSISSMGHDPANRKACRNTKAGH